MSTLTAEPAPSLAIPLPTAATFVSGTIAGVAQVLVGYPFDTTKVRLQTASPSSINSSSPWRVFSDLVKTEGIRGVYKGVGSPVGGVGICNAVLFSANSTFQNVIANYHSRKQHRVVPVTDHAISGAFSGFFIAFLACPIELLKVRLQAQSLSSTAAATSVAQLRYKGIADCFIHTYATNGLKGLYRGLPITILRDIPSFAAYFGVYEGLKMAWGSRTGAKGDGKVEIEKWKVFIIGGVAGVACWLPCYPMDVVKSIIQNDQSKNPPSIKSVVRQLIQTSPNAKIKPFFKGFTPTLLRAFPANAITFLVYEFVSGLL
ncbi:mitochondrial carrier domain-containing protein [Paraphysoderma sedebokerense]|nr:mitochondrial carrier domain-containing protein [Paraphysoderma sedebokerense]